MHIKKLNFQEHQMSCYIQYFALKEHERVAHAKSKGTSTLVLTKIFLACKYKV